jgi:hypothetical protein
LKSRYKFKENYNEILKLSWIPQHPGDPSSSSEKETYHLEAFTFKDFGVFALDSTVIWDPSSSPEGRS